MPKGTVFDQAKLTPIMHELNYIKSGRGSTTTFGSVDVRFILFRSKEADEDTLIRVKWKKMELSLELERMQTSNVNSPDLVRQCTTEHSTAPF